MLSLAMLSSMPNQELRRSVLLAVLTVMCAAAFFPGLAATVISQVVPYHLPEGSNATEEFGVLALLLACEACRVTFFAAPKNAPRKEAEAEAAPEDKLAPAEAEAAPEDNLAPAEAETAPVDKLAPAEAEAAPEDKLAPLEAEAAP